MEIIVGGIIEKDNKILMVKEAKKKCYGKWNVPAGHLEDGETIFKGAIRERRY
jgi:ADP-ribose pyrophosphatase YjhB (NUDIX family)